MIHIKQKVKTQEIISSRKNKLQEMKLNHSKLKLSGSSKSSTSIAIML